MLAVGDHPCGECSGEKHHDGLSLDHLTTFLLSLDDYIQPNQEDVARTPPAMVFFFLFLFAPLFAAFLLTVYVALCKPGCAISAAVTSSV